MQVFLNMVLSGFPAELDPNSDSAAVPDKICPALATIITPTTENGRAGRSEQASQERNGALAILAVGNGAQFAGWPRTHPWFSFCMRPLMGHFHSSNEWFMLHQGYLKQGP